MNDKLESVNCGCGGKSDIHFIGNTYIDEYCKFIEKYFICCEECGIKTPICNSKKEAIEVWNTAMSGVVYPCTTPNGVYTGGCTITNTTDDKDDFHPVYDCMVGKERMAKVVTEDNISICDNCSWVVFTGMKYCPSCGAKLEWE